MAHEFKAKNGVITPLVITSAGTATSAPLRLPHGTAPTTPANGDIWTTSTDIAVRINGVTKLLVGKNGDTMSGNLTFGGNVGLLWSANTDAASLVFVSSSDATSGNRALSNLVMTLMDNGNEGFAINSTNGSTTTEILYVNPLEFSYKSNAIWHAGNDGSGSGLDADLLDGQDGSYYLDWQNITNKPDPVITVTLSGDVTGSASATLTDLASGTVSISTTVAANSVALGTDTTGNYAASVAVSGNGLSLTGAAGEGTAYTIASNATAANTASTIVFRDSSGDFGANTITLAGELRGPASFVIDPSAVGDNTGTVVIKGNLQVDGTTTTINSTVVTIDDLNITLAANATTASAANGAGITVNGAAATILYASSTDTWNFNKTIVGSLTGNSSSTTALQTARTINGVSFDGTANVSFFDVFTPSAASPGPQTFPANTIRGFSAYSSSDFPSTFFSGISVIGSGGSYSGQLAWNWNTEEAAPTGLYFRTNDDTTTPSAWSAWRRVLVDGDVGNGGFTVTAGSGLTGGGSLGTANQSTSTSVTLSHGDTSTQASVDNANGTVIQDVTLDEYGHITALGSVDLDNRYYTETESDSLFVNTAGDTMTGRLILPSGASGGVAFPADAFGGSGDTASITLQTASGESTRMTFTMTNDVDDMFAFVAPSANGLLMNGNVVWHAGNDGTGSGLDADTLDGNHATAFATASHAHDYLPLTGGTLTGTLTINTGSPTVYFQDTDQNSAMLHCNSNLFYILRGGTNATTWTQVNGQWPAYWDLTNNNATFGGALWCAGDVTAYSDAKLKTNIVTIDNALDKVARLRGVYYTRKADDTQTRQIGVVAQEVQIVVPEAVMLHQDESDTEGTLGVAYGNLVGLLIEAVKEQQQEITDIKKQLADLMSLVTQLVK